MDNKTNLHPNAFIGFLLLLFFFITVQIFGSVIAEFYEERIQKNDIVWKVELGEKSSKEILLSFRKSEPFLRELGMVTEPLMDETHLYFVTNQSLHRARNQDQNLINYFEEFHNVVLSREDIQKSVVNFLDLKNLNSVAFDDYFLAEKKKLKISLDPPISLSEWISMSDSRTQKEFAPVFSKNILSECTVHSVDPYVLFYNGITPSHFIQQWDSFSEDFFPLPPYLLKSSVEPIKHHRSILKFPDPNLDLKFVNHFGRPVPLGNLMIQSSLNQKCALDMDSKQKVEWRGPNLGPKTELYFDFGLVGPIRKSRLLDLLVKKTALELPKHQLESLNLSGMHQRFTREMFFGLTLLFILILFPEKKFARFLGIFITSLFVLAELVPNGSALLWTENSLAAGIFLSCAQSVFHPLKARKRSFMVSTFINPMFICGFFLIFFFFSATNTDSFPNWFNSREAESFVMSMGMGSVCFWLIDLPSAFLGNQSNSPVPKKISGIQSLMSGLLVASSVCVYLVKPLQTVPLDTRFLLNSSVTESLGNAPPSGKLSALTLFSKKDFEIRPYHQEPILEVSHPVAAKNQNTVHQFIKNTMGADLKLQWTSSQKKHKNSLHFMVLAPKVVSSEDWFWTLQSGLSVGKEMASSAELEDMSRLQLAAGKRWSSPSQEKQLNFSADSWRVVQGKLNRLIHIYKLDQSGYMVLLKTKKELLFDSFWPIVFSLFIIGFVAKGRQAVLCSIPFYFVVPFLWIGFDPFPIDMILVDFVGVWVFYFPLLFLVLYLYALTWILYSYQIISDYSSKVDFYSLLKLSVLFWALFLVGFRKFDFVFCFLIAIGYAFVAKNVANLLYLRALKMSIFCYINFRKLSFLIVLLMGVWNGLPSQRVMAQNSLLNFQSESCADKGFIVLPVFAKTSGREKIEPRPILSEKVLQSIPCSMLASPFLMSKWSEIQKSSSLSLMEFVNWLKIYISDNKERIASDVKDQVLELFGSTKPELDIITVFVEEFYGSTAITMGVLKSTGNFVHGKSTVRETNITQGLEKLVHQLTSKQSDLFADILGENELISVYIKNHDNALMEEGSQKLADEIDAFVRTQLLFPLTPSFLERRPFFRLSEDQNGSNYVATISIKRDGSQIIASIKTLNKATNRVRTGWVQSNITQLHQFEMEVYDALLDALNKNEGFMDYNVSLSRDFYFPKSGAYSIWGINFLQNFGIGAFSARGRWGNRKTAGRKEQNLFSIGAGLGWNYRKLSWATGDFGVLFDLGFANEDKKTQSKELHVSLSPYGQFTFSPRENFIVTNSLGLEQYIRQSHLDQTRKFSVAHPWIRIGAGVSF